MLEIILLIMNFSFLTLGFVFILMDIINPKEIEEKSQEEESKGEEATFPPYCQYSLGFSFLAMILLSILSLFSY